MGEQGKKISDNIRKLQAQFNIDDAELRRHSGLSAGHFSDIVNGKVDNPGYFTLKPIADMLGVSVSRMIQGEEIANEVPLPIPKAYFAQQYNLYESSFVESLSKVAVILAQRGQMIHGKKKRTTGVIDAVAQVFRSILGTIEEIPYSEQEAHSDTDNQDAQMLVLIAAWARLPAEQRIPILEMIKQLSK